MAFDKAAERERQIQREMTGCRHFRGIQHKTCAAGLLYEGAKDPTARPLKLICLDRDANAKCDRLSLPTREEAEAEVDDRERKVAEFFGRLAVGVCQCGVRGEDWEQVGHCIYAKPCGHRVGQGDAAEYKLGVIEARAKEDGK